MDIMEKNWLKRYIQVIGRKEVGKGRVIWGNEGDNEGFRGPV